MKDEKGNVPFKTKSCEGLVPFARLKLKISLLNAGLRLPDYLTAPRDYFFLRPS